MSQSVVTNTEGKTVLAVSCPSGISSNMKQQYEDTTASTATFANNIKSYALYLGGGQAQNYVALANTSSTADAYSSATALECSELNPIMYRVYAAEHAIADSTTYGYTSAIGYVRPNKEATDITVAGSIVFVDFVGKRVDNLKATIKDKANQDKFLNATMLRQTGTGYSVLNNTWTDQGGETSLTIAADGYFDLEMDVKTNNTKNVFGNIDPRTGKPLVVSVNDKFQIVNTGGKAHALRTIVAIDADSSDWDEPSVNGGGITKIDKSSLASDDQTVLSNYEYFYTVDPLKDTSTKFSWNQQTKSGVNADMDPKWRFCSEGIYSSSDTTGTLKVGCFDDSSNNNELTTNSAGTGTLRHEIVLDIS